MYDLAAPAAAAVRAAAAGAELPAFSAAVWEQIVADLAGHDVAPFLRTAQRAASARSTAVDPARHHSSDWTG